MAHHIPDGGSCLVVYGSCVRVDSNGKVRTVDECGRFQGGLCCGSAVAAARSVAQLHSAAVQAKKKHILNNWMLNNNSSNIC